MPGFLAPIVLVVVSLLARPTIGASGMKFTTNEEAKHFIQWYETSVRPLEKKVKLAWWNANVFGTSEDFKKKEAAQNELDRLLSDPKRFSEIEALKEKVASISSPELRRETDLLYLTFLGKQVDPKLLGQINEKGNAIERAFNKYRAKVDGRELTDSEVRKILRESKDSNYRKRVWEASKGVGPVVEKELKDLVVLRNESARRLGFKNYQQLQLTLNEQSDEQVLKLFDELDHLTAEPFRKVKSEIDERLAHDYHVKVDELRPWHYHDPFFQESPSVFDLDLDTLYKSIDILKVVRGFYAGMGLPIDDVIAKSDLYEKPGKSPHAFCDDIDREGDVRVLGNIVPSDYWMTTMLHELGHSVYSSKNIPRSLPYVLRAESHILTTEGFAMMMERFSKNADFFEAMGIKLPDAKAFEQTASKVRRYKLLIFSRWAQVMFRFEKEMYENPSQDLNKVWWDLVEKYQGLKRPAGRNAPDYASKIHIVVAPIYYHNYLMGELFASQVHHTIAKQVLGGADPSKAIYVGNKQVGAFLKERIFAPGRMLRWNDLAVFATGEELNAKAFAADLK